MENKPAKQPEEPKKEIPKTINCPNCNKVIYEKEFCSCQYKKK